MNLFRILLASLASFLGLLTGLPGQAVQMKSGVLLIGEISDANGDGLSLKRSDNGGALQLKWDDLSIESAARIKQLFNLSVEDEAEVMADADVLAYELPGGGLAEAVCVILEHTGKSIVVRTKSAPRLEIPVESVRSRATRPVRALDLYTREEFYGKKLQELAPGDDADQHVALADLMMRVRDFDHAEQHLKRAKELGTSKQPAQIDSKLARLELYKAAAAEHGVLEEIQTAAGRSEFPRAQELIKKFETTWPQSKLKPELEGLKARVTKSRERWLVARVAEVWYMTIPRIADRKAGERGVTFAQARQYAETNLAKEIRTTVAKALAITEDEVNTLWKKRFEVKSVLRPNLYSYGIGSWLLGEAGVLENTAQGKAEDKDAKKKDQPRDEEMESLLRKIKAARARAAQSGQGDQQQQNEESFWKEFPTQSRSLWIQAYYVEKSGDLQLVRAMAEPCINCAGEGTITSLATGGDPKKEKCYVCHGTRFTRRIRAQ